MRRSLLTLATICLLLVVPVGVAMAQQGGFGIKGGATYSDLRGDIPRGTDVDPKIGWAAGAFIALEMSHNVIFQPEAYYVRRVVEFGDRTSRIYAVQTVDYIEVPFLLKFTSGDLYSRVRPTLFFGPSVAYLMEATFETDGPGFSDREDISDQLSDLDVGAVVGVGLDFAGGIQLDARYTYGLTNLPDDAPDSEDLKWGIVSAMLGFRF